MKSALVRPTNGSPPAIPPAGLFALALVGWTARVARGRLLARLSPPIPAAMLEVDGGAGQEIDWLKQIHRADRAAFTAWFGKIKGAATSVAPLQYRLLTPLENPVWVRHWAAPTVDRSASGLLQVIDDQKRIEAAALHAVEAERLHLGQELHDETCQLLSGLACLTAALAKSPASASPAALKSQLEDLGRELVASLGRIRTRAHSLVPAPVIRRGLASSLRSLVEQTEFLYGVKIALQLPSRLHRHNDHHVVQLHGIAHESIANAIKHGGATALEITLRAHGKIHQLEIRNNGRGLSDATGVQDGIGLHLMKHRAAILGARLTVKNARPRGVSVQLNYSVA